jgi:hypothetical protein
VNVTLRQVLCPNPLPRVLMVPKKKHTQGARGLSISMSLAKSLAHTCAEVVVAILCVEFVCSIGCCDKAGLASSTGGPDTRAHWMLRVLRTLCSCVLPHADSVLATPMIMIRMPLLYARQPKPVVCLHLSITRYPPTESAPCDVITTS